VFGVFLEDNLLLPFERVCGPVVGGDEVVHVFAQLARAGEAGPAQRLALQNGKPDFHLIHPRRVRGREMEMDVLVPGQPAVAQKPAAPLAGRGRTRLHGGGDCLIAGPSRGT
jgi:hypothetical protein